MKTKFFAYTISCRNTCKKSLAAQVCVLVAYLILLITYPEC